MASSFSLPLENLPRRRRRSLTRFLRGFELFINENFDGVTQPALPTSLTYTSGLATENTQSFSSPNELYNAPGSGKATYSLTTDPNSGNMYVDAYFKGNAGGAFTAGLALRAANNTALLGGAYTCYEVQFNNSGGAGFLGITIRRWNSGAVTNLATLAVTFAQGIYYRCRFWISDVGGNPFLSTSVQRQSDGNWVQTDGTFGATQATALTVTDSSVNKILGAGYVLTWTAQANSFTDNITSDALASYTWDKPWLWTTVASQNRTALGSGTGWNNGTTFTESGVTGVSIASQSNTDATHQAVTFAVGGASPGTLNTTDGGAESTTLPVQTPSFTLSPGAMTANGSQLFTVTATNMHGDVANEQFQISGISTCTIGATTWTNASSATFTITSSNAAGGTLTVSAPTSHAASQPITVNGEAFAVTPPAICPNLTNIPVSFDSTGAVSPGWNNSTVITQGGGTGASMSGLTNVSTIKETAHVNAGTANATLSYTDGVSTATQTVGTPSLAFSPANLTTSEGQTTVTITATNLPLNIPNVTYTFSDGGTGSTAGSFTNTGQYTTTVPITPGGVAGNITINVLVNGTVFASGTLPVASTYTWYDYVSLGTSNTGLSLTWVMKDPSGATLSTFAGITAVEIPAGSGDYFPSQPWTINTSWQGQISPVGSGLPANYGKVVINPKLPFTTGDLANIAAQVSLVLNTAIPASPTAGSVNDRLDAKVSSRSTYAGGPVASVLTGVTLAAGDTTAQTVAAWNGLVLSGSVIDPSPTQTGFLVSTTLTGGSAYVTFNKKVRFSTGLNAGFDNPIQAVTGGANPFFAFAVPFPKAVNQNDKFDLI